MRLRVIAVLSIFFVSACATNSGGYTNTSDLERRLRGMSEAEIVAKMGAPTETVQLSDGGSSWSYRDDIGGITGGECTINLVLKDAVVTAATVYARDNSFVSFPLGSCKNLIGNL